MVMKRWWKRNSAAAAHKLGRREWRVREGPVRVAAFYRCSRAVGKATVNE
jgi:hypothetical protein